MSAGLYRKLPVVIAAAQWFKNGDHPLDYSRTHQGLEGGELREFAPEERRAAQWEGDIVRYFRRPDVAGESACKHCGATMHVHGWIETLEGGHIVCPGDWVITGVKGEHYPCKPDIFSATYQSADAEILPLNDDTRAILGRPNFTCIGIAQLLRASGVEIKTRAEDEQATVLHYLLGFWFKHGEQWAEAAEADMKQRAEAATLASRQVPT